jgi:hypothetical protein
MPSSRPDSRTLAIDTHSQVVNGESGKAAVPKTSLRLAHWVVPIHTSRGGSPGGCRHPLQWTRTSRGAAHDPVNEGGGDPSGMGCEEVDGDGTSRAWVIAARLSRECRLSPAKRVVTTLQWVGPPSLRDEPRSAPASSRPAMGLAPRAWWRPFFHGTCRPAGTPCGWSPTADQ